MRKLEFKSRCERDLKRIKQRGLNEKTLFDVLGVLMRDGRLGGQFKPHKLTGEYRGLWECHIEQNWLLIYDINERHVVAYRTGSHEDLF